MIVDTGLHYKGMKRDEAIKLFVDKAWDDSDFTRKEVNVFPGMYQSSVLNLTSIQYLKLINALNKTCKFPHNVIRSSAMAWNSPIYSPRLQTSLYEIHWPQEASPSKRPALR